MPITQNTKISLRWWLLSDNLNRGVCWSQDQVLQITTDASRTGWGAHTGQLHFHGKWPLEFRFRSSTFKELYAIWEALLHTEDLSRLSRVNSFRQHYSGGFHSSSKWDKTQPPSGSSPKYILLGRTIPPVYLGSPSKRGSKPKGQLPKSPHSGLRRVVAAPEGFPVHHSEMGNLSDRPVCLKKKYTRWTDSFPSTPEISLWQWTRLLSLGPGIFN